VLRAKLDENIGRRGTEILQRAGWDVETVVGEDLSSAADETLIEVCRAEHRALISLDKDFANTLRFPPRRYPGIVVLRLSSSIDLDQIYNALQRVAELARTRVLSGRLWIVDAIRIREYTEPEHPPRSDQET